MATTDSEGAASELSPTAPGAALGTATPVRREHLDTLAVSILLACCLFWGFQQVLVKATIPEIAPVLQASLRFIGATLCLWLWCRWRGVPLFERDGSLRAGLLAGTLFAAEFAFLFVALQYTTASRVTVFLYTSPLWVAALVPLMVRAERMRPLQWAGIALAFLAIVFALHESFSGSANDRDAALLWRGDLLALIAGALWGLTTVIIRVTRLMRVSAEKLLFYQVAVSAVLLPFISLALGERWSFAFSGFAWLSLVLQTLIGAFLSYLAWMWLLGRYPATRISVFVFLTPLFAILFGAWWLNEAVTTTLLVALAFVAVGIVLVNRRAAPAPSRSAD